MAGRGWVGTGGTTAEQKGHRGQTGRIIQQRTGEDGWRRGPEGGAAKKGDKKNKTNVATVNKNDFISN